MIQSSIARRPVAAFISVFVLAGAFLRSLQYFAQPSLFVDEARLAVNIIDRGFLDLLFKPLSYDQSAPPLFLLTAKLFGAPFGYSELALRLPAFLASLVGLILFVFLARRLQGKVGLCVAVALFALSPALVMHGAEVKQYSGDVLAVILLFFVTLNVTESEFETRQIVIALLCGAIVVWFSSGAVLALVACGGAVMVSQNRRENARRLLILVIPGAISAALAAIWARGNVTPHTMAYFNRGWRASFFRFPPDTFMELIEPGRIVRGLLWNQLNLWWVATPALMLVVFGTIVFWKKGRGDVAVLLAGPIPVALVLSYARLYPFSGRLLLFALPGLVLLLANGVDSVTAFVRARLGHASRLGYAAMIIPMGIVAPAIIRTVADAPPWYNEEMRDVLTNMQSKRPPIEKFYVFFLAVPAVEYYAPRLGIPRSAWTAGTNNRDTVAKYIDDIRKAQKEGPFWIVFSHDDVWPTVRPGITRAFDSIGTRLDSIAHPQNPRGSGSKAYLYDVTPSGSLAQIRR